MVNKNLSSIQSQDHIAKLSQWFARFAEQAQDSKMYAQLSQKISEDQNLLSAIPDNKSQPVPNLFLASVNYLLFKYTDDELYGFYPSHSSQVEEEGFRCAR